MKKRQTAGTDERQMMTITMTMTLWSSLPLAEGEEATRGKWADR